MMCCIRIYTWILVLNCNWSAPLVICSIYIHSSKYCDFANETIRFSSIGQSNAIHFIANASASQTYFLFLSLCLFGSQSVVVLLPRATFLLLILLIKDSHKLTHEEFVSISVYKIGILSTRICSDDGKKNQVEVILVFLRWPLNYHSNISGRQYSRDALLQFHLVFRYVREFLPFVYAFFWHSPYFIVFFPVDLFLHVSVWRASSSKSSNTQNRMGGTSEW